MRFFKNTPDLHCAYYGFLAFSDSGTLGIGSGLRLMIFGLGLVKFGSGQVFFSFFSQF